LVISWFFIIWITAVGNAESFAVYSSNHWKTRDDCIEAVELFLQTLIYDKSGLMVMCVQKYTWHEEVDSFDKTQ